MVRRLTPLPSFESTHANDLNDNGIAVGRSESDGGTFSRATAWYPDGRIVQYDAANARFVNNQNLVWVSVR